MSNEVKIPIPARLYNAAQGGHVAGAEDIDFGSKVVHLKGDQSFESQVTSANTIYVIHDDFTLTSDVTIPANCVLEFDGGSISGNGTGKNTITGNNTQIKANEVAVFTGLSFAGTWNVPYITTKWLSDPARENALTQLFNLTNENVDNTINVAYGVYNVSTDVVYGRVIKLNSNTHIILNGTIQLVNSYFRGYSIIDTYNAKNITIEGSGKIIGNNDSMPSGIDGEFGFGIWIEGYNVTVKGIEICKCWGDGIFVGQDVTHTSPAVPEFPDETTNNVRILDCHIHNCRRQGISIALCDVAIIDGCVIHDISGAAPENGIDLEPMYDFQHVYNTIIRNCTVYNCTGLQVVDETASKDNLNNTLISSNTLYDIKPSTNVSASFGIRCWGYCTNVTITENNISNSLGASIITNAQGTVILNNIIKNTTPSESVTISNPCILIGAGTKGCRVIGNTINGYGYFIVPGKGTVIESNVIDTQEFMTFDSGALNRIDNITIRNNDIVNTVFSLNYFYSHIVGNNIVCKEMSFRNGYQKIQSNNITISKDKTFDFVLPERMLITGNNMNLGDHTMKIANDSIFANNVLVHSDISIEGASVSVDGNIFIGNAASGKYINVNADEVTITNNKFNHLASNAPICIYVQVTSASSIVVAFNLANNKVGRIMSKEASNTSIVTVLYNRRADNVGTYENATDMVMLAGIPNKGTTANRPTISVAGLVHQYFDTTLNKPIYWNGSAWVDSTGATV